jgi:hypothetical protein
LKRGAPEGTALCFDLRAIMLNTKWRPVGESNPCYNRERVVS